MENDEKVFRRRSGPPKHTDIRDVFPPSNELTEHLQSLSLSPTPSTVARRAYQAKPLGSWASLRGGWPNWVTQKGTRAVPVNFTITMNRCADYSGDITAAAFADAAQHIMDIRNLVSSAPGTPREVALDDALCEDMTAVVFGSNQIERVGAKLDETIRLCKEVFIGQRTAMEEIPPRSKEYEDRLEAFIMSDGSKQTHQIRERREVVNHAAAFVHMVKAIVKRDEPFTEDLIKETHRILCIKVDIENVATYDQYAGRYRNVPVAAGSTNFVVPRFVPTAMGRFVKDLNEKLVEAEFHKSLDPFAIAAWACSEFVNIHPFLDGNGRTCRLILNSILLRYAGICAPIGEHDHERREYMEIVKRRSSEESGHGELATFTLGRARNALKSLPSRLG